MAEWIVFGRAYTYNVQMKIEGGPQVSEGHYFTLSLWQLVLWQLVPHYYKTTFYPPTIGPQATRSLSEGL